MEKKKCSSCDGSGIIWLNGYIKAPCLECSPTRTLEDLEKDKDREVRRAVDEAWERNR